MSYLAPLRLHFAGRFQAAPSTVNNDPTHFDNATFLPQYQQFGDNQNPNGWWNPPGSADWRLIGCRVTGAWTADGPAAADDPVLSCLVADSDSRAPAKIVDLDPEQQLVSELWGLQVRIAGADGKTLLAGRFEPGAFMDIWTRASGRGAAGDIGACARYQSVLTDLEWADVSGSAVLTALRAAATDGLLSIAFNVDGYNMDRTSPEFTRGRVVGSIGVAAAGEPHCFVAGHRLMAVDTPGNQGFFAPQGRMNFCTAVVDEQQGKVYVDLGNSLPTTKPGGPLFDLGALSFVAVDTRTGRALSLGAVDYKQPDWYANTAGVAELPPDRKLGPAELEHLRRAQITARLSTSPYLALAELPDGFAARADRHVFRLDPGEQAEVAVLATHFGRPSPNRVVLLRADDSELQPWSAALPVGRPEKGIDFPASVTTGADGWARFTIEGRDPGNPRGYLDGQVYGIRPSLKVVDVPGRPIDPAEFVSVLVFDPFVPDGPPVTWASLQPVMQQYANLYPVMQDFLDLGDYDSVCQHRELLLLAFGLDLTDPNSMPVTRDLSKAKRAAILAWLQNVGADSRPLPGQPPAPTPPPLPLEDAEASESAPEPAVLAELAAQGGKTAAAARRLRVQQAGGAR